MQPRHEFRAHTAEIELFLAAPDLRSLFVEAGKALAELMAGEPLVPSGEAVEVAVRAEDREALLVGWLNELIFRSERDKRIYLAFELEQLTPRSLIARIRGAEPRTLKTAVKAATFHLLKIVETASGFTATVVLDV